ncbi:MAG: succinoglycan biosynthesis protein exop [Rhizobiaceae bacterium]|nr:succinoglycan biosynthesis protein exop [Rhizobiaceae bacterium]
MIESSHRDDETHSSSLLSLGQALRGDDPDESYFGETDAAMRHRLARSRRQSRPSPLLVALGEAENEPQRDHRSAEAETVAPAEMAPQPAVHEPAPVATPSAASGRSWSAADFLKRWLPGESWREPDTATAQQPGGPIPNEPPAYTAGQERTDTSSGPSQNRPRTTTASAAEAPAPARDDIYWRPLIDPMKVISGIFNSKMIILGTTVAGALLGVAIALSTPKKYEAFAELLIDPRDLKLSDRDLTQTGLPSDATLAIIENQVRVLTSGTVLTKVVDKLNLTNDPEFNGNASGITGVGDLIGILRSLLSRKDAGNAEEWREHALAVQNLASALKVERGGKTFVVSIGAKTEDPEKSALIANTLIDVFFQTYGEFQSKTAGRAADELTARLDELRKSVEEAERKVEAFKAEHDIVDAQGRPITDDDIVRLNDQLSTARARTLELNAKAQTTRALTVDNVLVGTLPEEIASATMTELRAQYARLRQDADRLGVRLGPRHPERLAAEAQLDGARDQIAAELRRIVSATQTELRRAVQLEQELAGRLAQIKVQQGDRNSDLVTLRELEREANARRAVYESFLLRAREAGEARDVNTANMSVISSAYPPLDPLGPSRAMIVLTGMILGFFSGVGIGAARGAYWSFKENAEIRRARSSVGPSGPDKPGGESRPLPVAPQVTEAVATRAHPSGAVMRDAYASTAEERLCEPADESFDDSPQDAPDTQQDDEAMKQDPFVDPRYPYPPQAAHYPYPYPYAPPYPHPLAAYPQHPAAAPYPASPAGWHAMAPHPFYPYPPQMQPGAYPPPPGFAPQPAPAEPARTDREASAQPDQQEAAVSIEDIRATLREFRDMVRDMADARQRQRSA